MRWVLLVWAFPLVLFWGWFGLSYYDVNFGSIWLSRRLHDLVFQLYGQTLGIDPATIPMLIAKACAFDTLVLLAIWAYRRRRELVARFKLLRERYWDAEPAGSL